MRDAIGYRGVFIAYACVCALGGLGVVWLLPETKGKTLAEIEILIGTRSGCPCFPHGHDAALAASLRANGSRQTLDSDADDAERAQLKSRASSAFVLAI